MLIGSHHQRLAASRALPPVVLLHESIHTRLGLNLEMHPPRTLDVHPADGCNEAHLATRARDPLPSCHSADCGDQSKAHSAPPASTSRSRLVRSTRVADRSCGRAAPAPRKSIPWHHFQIGVGRWRGPPTAPPLVRAFRHSLSKNLPPKPRNSTSRELH